MPFLIFADEAESFIIEFTSAIVGACLSVTNYHMYLSCSIRTIHHYHLNNILQFIFFIKGYECHVTLIAFYSIYFYIKLLVFQISESLFGFCLFRFFKLVVLCRRNEFAYLIDVVMDISDYHIFLLFFS